MHIVQRFLLGFLLSILLICPQILLANEHVNTNILLLHSYHEDMPWSKKFHFGFKKHLQGSSNLKIHTEYLDLARFKKNTIGESLWDHLENKYQNKQIDIVVLDDVVAAGLIKEYAGTLFSETKAIYIGSIDPFKNGPPPINSYWLPTITDYKQAIPLIAKLQPGITQVEIVSDETPVNIQRVKKLKEDFGQNEEQIRIGFYTDFTFEELFEHVKNLPSTTALIYTPVFQDSTGTQLVPKKVLQKITALSEAPVYSYWDTFMGTGIVGGYLISAEKSGQKAAELSIALSRGRSISNESLSAETQSGYYFDAEQLQRWGINKNKLPSGSTIINQHPSFYDRYYREIGAVLLLIFAQGLLIMFLFRSRQKTRRLAGEVAAAKNTLEETVEERTKDLRQLEERFRSLFEQSLDTIILFQAQAASPPIIYDINPEGCRILGYDREELIGKSVSEINTDEHREQIPARMRLLERGEIVRFESSHIKKNGEVFPLEVVSKKIMIGQQHYYLSVERDISERRQQELAMQRNEERLEELVAERTEKLERTIKLMVGRELRMGELKKEIRHLQKKLDEAGCSTLVPPPRS